MSGVPVRDYGAQVDALSIACRRSVERQLKGEPEGSYPLHGGCLDLHIPLYLAAVNAAIWDREGAIRRVIARGATDDPPTNKEIADLARAICWLNDRRRGLIYKLSGRSGEEKIYT